MSSAPVALRVMAESPNTWYTAAKDKLHSCVFSHVEYVRKQQSDMRDSWVDFMEMYAAGNVSGLGVSHATGYYYGRERTEGDPEVRFNLAAALVDTGASLISQAPTVPQYLTTDGDFKLIRQARKASQILQGQFTAEVKEECKRAWLDAAKIGTGFVFESYDPITGLPGVERVHALEVYVEHLDGMRMRPRSLHRSRIIPKETLKEQYPRLANEIECSPAVTHSRAIDILLPGIGAGFAFSEFVEVVESWHLRPGKKGKGRHTMCIGSATLLDEEWKRDEFPCATFRYRERDVGYYGSGLIESCAPAQNRIDALIRRVARGQDLASNILIFNPNGEGSVQATKFTNDIGLIINYEPMNGAPTLAKWEGTLDDLQQQIDLEFARALQVEGISETQTNGQGAGRGLDSGVAVRAADDVQSRRLVPFVSRFQVSCLGVARIFEAMNDRLSEKSPGTKIVAEGGSEMRQFLRTANWKDVRPPKGDCRLSMAPMSSLPTAPAAKFAAVMDWVAGGFVSRIYAMNLLQFPDLDAYASIELAHLDLARWQCEKLVDGEAVMPDPRQDLQLAIDLATKCKMKAVTMSADEDDLELFETFIVECEWLAEMAVQQEAANQPPAPTPMPGVDPATGLPLGVIAPGLGASAPVAA